MSEETEDQEPDLNRIMKPKSKNQTTKAATKVRDLKPASNPKGGALSSNDFQITKQIDKTSPKLDSASPLLY